GEHLLAVDHDLEWLGLLHELRERHGTRSLRRHGPDATLRRVRRVLLLLLVGCGPQHHGLDANGGGGGDGDAQQDCGSLAVTLRDFQSSHPDFEKSIGDDRGVIATMLGSDHKPVYTPAGVSPGGTISGPASYDQWY